MLCFAQAYAQKDPFVGFYKGELKNVNSYPFQTEPQVCAEVALFPDGYSFKLTSEPLKRADTYALAKNLKAEGGKIAFKDDLKLKLEGVITPGKIVVKGKNSKGGEITGELVKTELTSPTTGLKPPAGATVLFDGKDTSEWVQEDGSPCVWQIKDGAMISQPMFVNGKKKDGTIFTKKKFGAVKMHVEFKIPAEYAADPNGRGNSGVHFGPYEIQIIDSFGGEGCWWQCGAVYRMHAPKVNASFEPEAWQTFDIEFTPAKFENGKLTALPEFTVYQNGVRVQYKEPVYHRTNIAFKNLPHPQELLPLGLQDHSHPIAFRNVWAQEL